MGKLISLLLLLGCSAGAHALTLTFQNTYFDDGGQLSGSFEIDSNGYIYNWNLVTTSGSSNPGSSYSQWSPTSPAYCQAGNCQSQFGPYSGAGYVLGGWDQNLGFGKFLAFNFSQVFANIPQNVDSFGNQKPGESGLNAFDPGETVAFDQSICAFTGGWCERNSADIGESVVFLNQRYIVSGELLASGASVPIPAAAWLFGSGLVLLGVRRAKVKSAG